MHLLHTDRMPPIKAVMTPFPYSVDVDDPVSRADALMAEHGIRHVPVHEGDTLVGVATERDIGSLVNRALDRRSRERIKVRDVCTRDPYVVDLETSLDRVLMGMAERHIGSALVTRKGRLAGIFTVTDACRVLALVLREAHGPSGGGDEAA